MYYNNGQSACDIGNPIYNKRSKPETIRGLCTARIFKGDTDEDFVDVEISYEATRNFDGYEVDCERPEVADASDLLQDITYALNEDGIQSVTKINWL